MWCLLIPFLVFPGLARTDDTLYISPISMTRRENETVTLDCFTSRNLDDHFFIWGSAKPTDQLISWILYWTPGSAGSLYSVPGTDRFSGSKDWASKRFSLTIKDLQREDSARYYCGSSNTYFPYSTDWSGCGVTLTVNSAPPQSPPLVHFHHPSPEDVLQQREIALLCVAEDFYPEAISITWSVDGQEVSAGVSHSESLLGPNSTYTKISKLSTGTSHWIKGSVYSCHVAHETLDSPISKHVSNAGQYPKVPAVYLLPAGRGEMDVKETTISCLAVGYYPGEISFRWSVNRDPVVNAAKSFEPIRNDNGTYSARSDLVTSTDMWNLGSVYTCKVQHVSVPDGLVRSVNKTRVLVFRQPTITPIRLPSDNSVQAQTVTLACYISGFYPPDIYVTWKTERGVQELGWVTNFPVVADASGSYSTASQMTIPLSDVDRSLTYVCMVAHDSISFPIEEWFQIS